LEAFDILGLMRIELGGQIAARLSTECEHLTRQFHTPGHVPFFQIDDLLDPGLARQIYSSFPPKEEMVLKKNLGQKKYIAVQMNRYAAILEEIIYAFQEPCVVKAVEQITGIPDLIPDGNLYAGGLSLMERGNYLNPHLDNSHDKDQKLFRALNLLYYVTPDWREEYGGNFELWDDGPSGKPRTIWSRFNRLVVMGTTTTSWHSVSEVQADHARCCVSNYYFTTVPLDENPEYHVTTFRGRPAERVRDVLMVADNVVRTAVRKTFGERLFRNPHVYKDSSK
jgi:Rps23 Pro-64 3,4-dihydroxylase Tpa1-like proline 4-hydroxylase